MEGELRHPSTLAGLRTLPLAAGAPVLVPEDPTAVTTVLRWLHAARASGQLLLEGRRRVELHFLDGRLLVPERERQSQLGGDLLLWPDGRWRFEPSNALPPALFRPTRVYTFTIQLVKRFLRELELDDLRAALPTATAPRLTQRGAGQLPALSLAGNEERFLSRRCDGSETLDRLFIAAGLSDSAVLRTLHVADLLGLVEWVEPALDGSRGAVDEIAELLELRSRVDHFRAIGAHPTDAPTRLRAAYEEVIERYGAGSDAARRSPDAARGLVELAERAWAAIADRTARQEYRRQQLHLPTAALADLLYDQVEVELMRRELRHARELLEEAVELDPRPRFVAILAELRRDPDAR